jgi:hypothetical protein
VVARLFCLLPQTLNYWYRNYLSDYKTDRASGQCPPNQVIISNEDMAEILNELPVYVFKPENVGEKMSINDKAIGHEGFTIRS